MAACKNGHLHFKSRKPCWWKFHSSDPTPCSLTALHSSKAVYRINSKWSMNCLSGRPCYLFQWCTRSHNNWAARSKIKQNIYALLVEYTSHNSQIWHVVSLVYDEGDGWCLRFLVCTRILCSWSTYHSAPSHPPSTDWITSPDQSIKWIVNQLIREMSSGSSFVEDRFDGALGSDILHFQQINFIIISIILSHSKPWSSCFFHLIISLGMFSHNNYLLLTSRGTLDTGVRSVGWTRAAPGSQGLSS